MFEKNGEWIMEGLSSNDSKRIKNINEMYEYIDTVGFLPLFRNHVDGFSLEELTSSEAWFSDTTEDPWLWRAQAAEGNKVFYGKFFGKKAGFISKEWFPYFAAYRRDGYDFDTLYEIGNASKKSKVIMTALEQRSLPSHKLKQLSSDPQNTGGCFETVITHLMMQTYVLITGFEKKLNRSGIEYGWPVAVYSIAENKFDKDLIRSKYGMTRQDAFDFILKQMHRLYPEATEKDIRKEI